MKGQIKKIVQYRRMKVRGKRFAAGLLTAVLSLGLLSGNGTMAYAVENQDASVDLTEGLIGYWTFEGESDTDCLASKASVADVKAVKTGTGVTLLDSGGVDGGAVSFSGDNTSYLTLNLTDAGKNLVASTNPFTIGAWIKYESDMAESNTGISVFHQDGTNSGRAILMIKNSGGMQYGTYLAESNQYCTGQIEAGKWHHVMISVDAAGESRNARIYVDGTLANGASSALAQALVDGTGNIRVGAHRQNTNSQAIKGVMDEIRYYDRVLSAEEIKTIYDVYGGQAETENLKAELQGMITLAKEMTGGSEAAWEDLEKIVAEAEALLNSDSLTADALEQKKIELQEAINEYEASAPIAIAVDTAEELRNIPSAMFGINHRYHNYGYGSWDEENDKIFDEFNLLAKEAGFGSVRYPGGTVSNLFTWKDTIGPKDQRTTTIAGNNFYSNAGETPVDPAFGVDEAMSWIYDDLGSEAIFVYGLGRGTPEDAADLVEYLNAPNDGSNPNGGTDWAAERAKNGHPKPYGVIRFELGNEFSDTGQDYWMSGSRQTYSGDDVGLYINGDTITISGQQSYYQVNNRVSKKGDWRASASLGDGTENQERYVYYFPVVEGSASVTVGGTAWTIVDSLEGQGAENVCTFDYETGKITFGDGTNGNIPASGADIRCNYTTEQAGFVDYYDAMQQVAAEIGMKIEVYSGIYDGKQSSFIDKMHEKGYDDKYDGVIIHPYSSGVTSYEDSLVKAKNFSNNIATYKNKMETATGDDSKKVAVSEFGILRVTPESTYQSSLGHAIYIANHMIDCVNAGAAYQNKHCLVDTAGVSDNLGNWQQCVIQTHQTENGNKYVSTPSARLFSIFNNMTGSIEVDQEITGNQVFTGSGNNAVYNLNVYSTKDEYGNTYVMVVNNKESNVTAVDISIDGQDLTGKEIDVWYLASENVTDVNTLADPDKIVVQKETLTGSGTNIAYTLEPHSVYSFKVKAQKTSVTATVDGEGGTVSGGSDEAVVGGEITVTATPDNGYEFVGWYDGENLVSTDASYTFYVTEEVTLTAKFKKQSSSSQKVRVTVNAETGGTAEGSAEVDERSVVTVKATANDGYEFAGWYHGDKKVSGDASYTFTAEADITLTAKFTKKSVAANVTVTVQAGEGGTASGTKTVSAGSSVTVTAAAGEGYEFAGWYSGTALVSTAASYTFAPSTNITLTATFRQKAVNGGNEEDMVFSSGKFNYRILDKAKKTVIVQSGIEKKAKNVKKLTIPATVKINGIKYKVVQIGPSAFLNYKKLTTVVIGKNVTEIGKDAFRNCSKLKCITLKGAKLKKIQTGAFKNTAANISVKLPKSLKGKKRAALLTGFKKAGMSKKAKIK